MATFLDSFKNRAICVPLIQRDYVQSLSTAIIESFVDQLIDVLSDSSCQKYMNLNYIYGIDHPHAGFDEFEPVDGQQRLTTLWLFCLYLSRHLNLSDYGATFSVKIIYESREYADSFCAEIVKHKSWAKFTDNFEESITNQNWFVPDWEKDTSVIAMIKALAVISRKLNRLDEQTLKNIWERLNSADCPVTFSFFPTDTLGDDIYIKMNGRGRSLTAFENLKSWLDEKLTGFLPDRSRQSDCRNGCSERFSQKWKDEMDNAWTNLFWSNRVTGSYEIDDMQLRLFYNMVCLYWNFEDRNQILPPDCDIEELAILLNLNVAEADRQSVTEAILNKIVKASNYALPLYILDKINLCPLKFFLWYRKVLNGLCAINPAMKEISDSEIYFWGKSHDEETGESRTLLYQIMMSESGQERVSMEKLAISYALCKFACFHNQTRTSLPDWLYRCRNLILNNSFSSENFSKALRSVSSLFDDCMKFEIDILLKQDNFRLNYFTEKYIRLEKYKSEILTSGNGELSSAMRNLENMPFFVGSVLCLPILISSEEAIENPAKFIKICHILSSVLNEDGPKYEDKFRRALLYFSEPAVGYGGWEGKLWSFLKGKGDWQWFFNDTETDEIIKASNRKALKDIVEYLLQSETDDYDQCLKDLISIFSNVHDKYPVLNSDDWRYPFVYNAKVLGFMRDKCCRRKLPYNIVLSKSTVIRTNSDHFSLQTYLLYREYKDGVLPLGDGWTIDRYMRENSCAEFKKGDLKITVEFMSDQNKVNAFSIRIFSVKQENGIQNIGDACFKPVIDYLSPEQYSFDEHDGIRLNNLAHEQVVKHLAALMDSF